MRELLLRLRGDDGGLIPPGSFLPTAERFGLMPRVDRWVIARAVAHRAAAPDAVPLAVNLSGRSLDDPRMGEFVAAELMRHEVPPEALVLEITEHMAVASVVEARRFAQWLSRLGCGLALDDFGTGFASFHYLKHMPFGFLKIAGDFVREVERRPQDHLLLEAMVRVGRGMGLRTIAEWVEGEATLDALRELGVDYAQGFHLGRPEPL